MTKKRRRFSAEFTSRVAWEAATVDAWCRSLPPERCPRTPRLGSHSDGTVRADWPAQVGTGVGEKKSTHFS